MKKKYTGLSLVSLEEYKLLVDAKAGGIKS